MCRPQYKNLRFLRLRCTQQMSVFEHTPFVPLGVPLGVPPVLLHAYLQRRILEKVPSNLAYQANTSARPEFVGRLSLQNHCRFQNRHRPLCEFRDILPSNMHLDQRLKQNLTKRIGLVPTTSSNASDARSARWSSVKTLSSNVC